MVKNKSIALENAGQLSKLVLTKPVVDENDVTWKKAYLSACPKFPAIESRLIAIAIVATSNIDR
jgi:hypothetical protein